MTLAKKDLVIGDKYHWIGQEERLVYLGHNWSGNGFWYQFALVTEPTVVWSECLCMDLENLTKTREE